MISNFNDEYAVISTLSSHWIQRIIGTNHIGIGLSHINRLLNATWIAKFYSMKSITYSLVLLFLQLFAAHWIFSHNYYSILHNILYLVHVVYIRTISPNSINYTSMCSQSNYSSNITQSASIARTILYLCAFSYNQIFNKAILVHFFDMSILGSVILSIIKLLEHIINSKSLQ